GGTTKHHARNTGLSIKCMDIVDGDAQLVLIDGKGMTWNRTRINERDKIYSVLWLGMNDTAVAIEPGVAILVVSDTRVGVKLQDMRKTNILMGQTVLTRLPDAVVLPR